MGNRRGQDQLNDLVNLAASHFRGGLEELTLEFKGGKEKIRIHVRGRTAAVGEASLSSTSGAVGSFRPSWSIRGHEVVAWIAEDEINDEHPEVMEALEEIYDNDPEQGLRGSDLLQYAGWPDRIKARRPRTKPWHYITLFYNGDPTSAPPTEGDFPQGPHVVSALEEQLEILRSSADPLKRGEALGFVTHLVGDIHQPLHTLSLKNHDFPQGDRGGNLFKLARGGSMHKLWDGFVASRGARAPIAAAKLKDKHPRDSFSAAELGVESLADWVLESHALARQAYDEVLKLDEPDRVTKNYRDWARKLARRQAALGGYRLARLLVDSLS